MRRRNVLSILLILSICLNVGLLWKTLHSDLETKVERKEAAEVKWTEKKDSMPDAKLEKVVGMIKVPVQKSSRNNEIEETEECLRSDYGLKDSDSVDSIEVERTQKIYSDSTYTAYVSGYMPSLDSIFVRQKEVYRTVTETRTVQECNRRRWSVGLTAAYGYGFQSKAFDFFVGVGVTYKLNPP